MFLLVFVPGNAPVVVIRILSLDIRTGYPAFRDGVYESPFTHIHGFESHIVVSSNER